MKENFRYFWMLFRKLSLFLYHFDKSRQMRLIINTIHQIYTLSIIWSIYRLHRVIFLAPTPFKVQICLHSSPYSSAIFSLVSASLLLSWFYAFDQGHNWGYIIYKRVDIRMISLSEAKQKQDLFFASKMLADWDCLPQKDF